MNNDVKPGEATGQCSTKIILFRARCFNTDNKIILLEKLLELGFDLVTIDDEVITSYYNVNKLKIDVESKRNSNFTLFINDKKEATMTQDGTIKFVRFNAKKLLKRFEQRNKLKK